MAVAINNVNITDPTGYANSFGGTFIKGKSYAKVTISATSSVGSTISYNAISNNKILKGNPFSTPVLTRNSTGIKIYAKDSSGTTTKDIVVTAVDYANPLISNLTAVRCDENGNTHAQGTYLKIAYEYSVSSVNNKNTANFTIKIKKNTETSSTTVATYSDLSRKSYVLASGINSNDYTVTATLSDKILTTTETAGVDTIPSILEIHSSGTGMAIYKDAEQGELLDVNLPVLNRKDVNFEAEWQYLNLVENFKPYNDVYSNSPKIRKKGGTVEIIGMVSPVNEMTSSTNVITMATRIPDNMCPDATRYYVCQGSGMNRWLLTVYSSGYIGVSRYGTTTYATAESNHWLPFNVTYTV